MRATEKKTKNASKLIQPLKIVSFIALLLVNYRSLCWLNARSTDVTFLCSFTGLNAWSTVRWLSFKILSFKVVLPNCDTVSFFIEGLKSHCDMQMFRRSAWTRKSSIENQFNFGPQIISIKISVQPDQIPALQSAPNRSDLKRFKSLQSA